MAKVSAKGRVNLTYNSSSSDEDDNVTPDKDDDAEEESVSEREEESGSSGIENESDHEKSAGWADAISKVLQTKINKKTFILSKAKKDRDINMGPKPKVHEIEVLGEDGKVTIIKDSVPQQDSVGDASMTTIEVHEETKRREWENIGRVKPALQEKEKESTLCSLATGGVVQLFNAVNQQQQKIKEKLAEAGPLDRKKDKALASFTTKNFLDTLKDEGEKSKGEKRRLKSKDGEGGWKVLKDDFLDKAKIKDWDKEGSGDDDSD